MLIVNVTCLSIYIYAALEFLPHQTRSGNKTYHDKISRKYDAHVKGYAIIITLYNNLNALRHAYVV